VFRTPHDSFVATHLNISYAPLSTLDTHDLSLGVAVVPHLIALLPASALAFSQRPPDEAKICAAAQIVLVGTVNSFADVYTDTVHGGGKFTKRRLDIELLIHGTPPPDLTVDIPGDWTAGGTSIVGFPDWSTGTRHLLILRYLPAGPNDPAHWARIHDRVLDASVELPDVHVAQEIWAEHCAEHRTDLTAPPGQPSAPYIQYLSAPYLTACTHY
jgi:hypothetical protein